MSWEMKSFKAREIVEKIKNKSITVPQYQRGQVWKPKKQEELIDSIQKGYPFGTILLYERENKKEYHLIDGLQRCTTLYKYLQNPTKFFNVDINIDKEVINKIYKLSSVKGNEKATKDIITNTIVNWVKDNYKNLDAISNIRSNLCADEIISKFPSLKEDPSNHRKIDDMLNEMFLSYKKTCSEINESPIPAIVFKGDEEKLPEVFRRINTQGVNLSKYQILAATWAIHKRKITEQDLDPILVYVAKFYETITDEGFELTDYGKAEFLNQKVSNLYQIFFGFGKLITEKYPHLFGESSRDEDVESCGFNLINACLVNKNSKLPNASEIISEIFENNDEKFNKFLVNIIACIDIVNKILEPYLIFKLNTRTSKNSPYHSELQICSAIANVFVNRYVTITYGENEEIVGRVINVHKSNSNWDKFRSNFKRNFFKKYILDILQGKWSGTGDKTLDEIVINNDYYSKNINQNEFSDQLTSWFRSSNLNKQELSRVAKPNNAEKLLLSIIYINEFSAMDQLDGTKYDIEHLCTKKMMKEKLEKFNGELRLPISSFGNICLLPQWDNRKKKDKTLYNDINYLNIVGDKLKIIEEKYTFTTKEDMEWTNNQKLNKSEIEKEYMNFINKRFEVQKNKIIDNLFK